MFLGLAGISSSLGCLGRLGGWSPLRTFARRLGKSAQVLFTIVTLLLMMMTMAMMKMNVMKMVDN